MNDGSRIHQGIEVWHLRDKFTMSKHKYTNQHQIIKIIYLAQLEMDHCNLTNIPHYKGTINIPMKTTWVRHKI